MASTAPGSVKLFGEHAVIYGRTGVSAAFGKHATVRISTPASRTVSLAIPDFNFSCSLNEEQFSDKFISASEALKSGDLKRLNALRGEDFSLPFIYLIGSALLRKGFRPLAVTAASAIPKHSGLASSSAIFSALANELNESLCLKLSTEGVVDLANKGDAIVHGRPSGIDANTCVRGGFLKFRKGGDISQIEVPSPIKAVISNTLVSKDTGKMIAKVSAARDADSSAIEDVFDEMEEAGFAGLDALTAGDMLKLGAELDRASACFTRLGLNTKESDEIIAAAKKNGAYGAKLSGAGGGGCILIIHPSPGKLVPILNGLGFPSFETQLGVPGVSHSVFDPVV